MNNSTQLLEGFIKQLNIEFNYIATETKDLIKFYNSSGAANLVSALSNASDPATQSTGLTKNQVQLMAALLTELNDFFTNAAVSSSDYLSTCEDIINGSAVLTTPLSPATEILGERMVALANRLIAAKNNADTYYKLYFSSEISTAVSAVSSSLIIFGCSTTASKFNNGAVIMSQFLNFMTNQTVTQGDYLAIALNWANES